MIFKLITAAILLSLSALMGTAFYYVIFEEPWLVYRNIPFPATAQGVRAGEVVPIRVSLCNTSGKAQRYSIARSLQEVNTGALIYMVDLLIPSLPGCRESTSLAHIVPKEVPPGRYRLIGQSEIQGTLRTFRVDWASQPFEVIP